MRIFSIGTGDFWVALSSFRERDALKSCGWRWMPEHKVWWTNQQDRMRHLADRCRCDPRAWDGSLQELVRCDGREPELIPDEGHPSCAVTTDYDPPVPAGLAYIPFQRAGIEYAMARRHTLIADDMGLGKTVQALGFVNSLPAGEAKRILVVCPASLKWNWKSEAEKWLCDWRHIRIIGREKAFGDGVWIVNYDQVKKHHSTLCLHEWDVVIFDEAHALKSTTSARSRLCVGEKPIPSRRILFLTGTPIANRPVELWPMLARCFPDRFRSFLEFAYKYCDAQDTDMGLDSSGSSNSAELQGWLRENFMVRRMKSQVLKDLPEKWVRVVHMEDIDPVAVDAAEEYRAAKRQVLEYRQNGAPGATQEEKLDAWDEANRFMRGAQARALTAARDAKMEPVGDYVAEAIEESAASGAKVIVFCKHTEMSAYLMRRFGRAAVCITGASSQPDRQRAVQRFRSDDSVSLFVGQIIAAGAGLTLVEANRVIFAELDWVPANMLQGEDRAHRIGQTRGVTVDYLVATGTIDDDIMVALERKKEVIGRSVNV